MEEKHDRPEDVQGGLKLALMQDWTAEAVKRVVLICDAPSHGFYKCHYDKDNYPKGTPDMPSLKSITKEFMKKDIAFQLVKLEPIMDKMVDEMKKWNPGIDIIDMTPLSSSHSLGVFNYGFADDESRKRIRDEIREQFMRETNEGMQRQMNRRFSDREAIRKARRQGLA